MVETSDVRCEQDGTGYLVSFTSREAHMNYRPAYGGYAYAEENELATIRRLVKLREAGALVPQAILDTLRERLLENIPEGATAITE